LNINIIDVVRRRIKDKLAGDVLDLPSYSLKENRKIWNSYNWSQKGEEWTYDAENSGDFKINLLEIMQKYIRPNSTILEIGPGAGRWTVYLQKLAKKLIAVDIAPNAIRECKKNLGSDIKNIDFHIIDNIDLKFIVDNSIEYVWSYDVFVHINPSDAEKYVTEFARILKKDGIAIIHHANKYESPAVARKGWRTKLDENLMRQYVTNTGFEMIEQNKELPHKKGDIISIFKK